MSLRVERGRTLARSQALQILFQAEARDMPVDQVLDSDVLLSKGPLSPYAEKLARGCYANLDRIDYALHKVSQNWSLYRMPSSDRNLLRIAVYEMRLLEDDPVDDAVVINEAVEIAKAYGTDESARFVNGVLGRIARAGKLPEPPEKEEGASVSADGAADIDAQPAPAAPADDANGDA